MIKLLSEQEAKEWADSQSGFHGKFAQASWSLWKRFQSFDRHKPLGFVDEKGDVVALTYISASEKTQYANLYNISVHSDHQGNGYGFKLWLDVVGHLQERGIKRIKLSAEPQSVKFWHEKCFLTFWSYDDHCALRTDQPLLLPSEARILRESVVKAPELYLPPPERVKQLLELPKLSKAKLEKVQASIELVKPYYFYDALPKENNLLGFFND